MSFRSFLSSLLLTIVCFTSANTIAETVWLSDTLWVNVRTGAGENFRILKTIPSGTRMEVLERNEDAGFSRIRTEDGLEGWVPFRFLIDEPTGRIVAATLETEKQQLAEQLAEVEQKYRDLLADKGDVGGELESLRTNNANLTEELNRIKAISESALQLDEQYQLMAQENAQLKNSLDVAQAQNQSLKDFNDNRMLYTGAAILILGIFMGVVLPRLSGKRRRDGWQ